MSSEEFIHLLNNQLTVVLGQAESLAVSAEDPASLHASTTIKTAVENMRNLVTQFVQQSS